MQNQIKNPTQRQLHRIQKVMHGTIKHPKNVLIVPPFYKFVKGFSLKS